MCFSAGASFGAGIVLSVIGIAALKKAKSPSEKFFASIPLLFAVQQCGEGLLWLALTQPEYAAWKHLGMYTFLFFAYVVWSVWIPVSITWLEKDRQRKKILLLLTSLGVLSSIYLAYCLLNFHIEATVADHHIMYKPDFPVILKYINIPMYAIATAIPSFISTRKNMWMVGTTILISYVISFIFYTNYVVSVWCFFATVISMAVWVVLRTIRQGAREMVTAE